MIYFTCSVCRTQLSADDRYAGKLMRCPTCMSAQTVQAPRETAAVGAGRPAAPPRVAPLRPTGARRYGFNCPYCRSRLEADEAHAGSEGHCPTCGLSLTIPIIDRHGRLIHAGPRRHELQDPHPVHAYAADGKRAPLIVRLSDGGQQIQCAKCGTYSSILSNNCRQCGTPFTIEGTEVESIGGNNGFCVASMVLGIIGLVTFCTGVIPGLAILFGIIGYNQVSNNIDARGKGMAIAGIVCGALGALLFGLVYVN